MICSGCILFLSLFLSINVFGFLCISFDWHHLQDATRKTIIPISKLLITLLCYVYFVIYTIIATNWMRYVCCSILSSFLFFALHLKSQIKCCCYWFCSKSLWTEICLLVVIIFFIVIFVFFLTSYHIFFIFKCG